VDGSSGALKETCSPVLDVFNPSTYPPNHALSLLAQCADRRGQERPQPRRHHLRAGPLFPNDGASPPVLLLEYSLLFPGKHLRRGSRFNVFMFLCCMYHPLPFYRLGRHNIFTVGYPFSFAFSYIYFCTLLFPPLLILQSFPPSSRKTVASWVAPAFAGAPLTFLFPSFLYFT